VLPKKVEKMAFLSPPTSRQVRTICTDCIVSITTTTPPTSRSH